MSVLLPCSYSLSFHFHFHVHSISFLSVSFLSLLLLSFCFRSFRFVAFREVSFSFHVSSSLESPCKFAVHIHFVQVLELISFQLHVRLSTRSQFGCSVDVVSPLRIPIWPRSQAP